MKAVHEYVEGDADALSSLVPLIGERLRRLAARPVSSANAPSPITVLSEIYARLENGRPVPGLTRGSFLSAAGRAMRQFLVDSAKTAVKDPGLKALVLALDRLAAFDERLLRVVEQRYLLGVGVDEAAEALRLSAPTVAREWLIAKAWLHRELQTPVAAS